MVLKRACTITSDKPAVNERGSAVVEPAIKSRPAKQAKSEAETKPAVRFRIPKIKPALAVKARVGKPGGASLGALKDTLACGDDQPKVNAPDDEAMHAMTTMRRASIALRVEMPREGLSMRIRVLLQAATERRPLCKGVCGSPAMQAVAQKRSV